MRKALLTTGGILGIPGIILGLCAASLADSPYVRCFRGISIELVIILIGIAAAVILIDHRTKKGGSS